MQFQNIDFSPELEIPSQLSAAKSGDFTGARVDAILSLVHTRDIDSVLRYFIHLDEMSYSENENSHFLSSFEASYLLHSCSSSLLRDFFSSYLKSLISYPKSIKSLFPKIDPNDLTFLVLRLYD